MASSSTAPRNASDSLEQKTPFATIFEREVEKLGLARVTAAPYRAGAGKAAPADTSAVGLALSGGGIRSAAFALGVMQALDADDCFEGVDFLSTVSGGGYAGAALIAGLKRDGGTFPFKANAGAPLTPVDVADNQAVKDIRDHSRYLMPHGRFDLVVSCAIIMRGLAVNVVLVACLLCLAAGITLVFTPTRGTLEQSWVMRSGQYFNDLMSLHVDTSPPAAELLDAGGWLPATKILLVALAVWLILWAIFRSIVTNESRASDDALSDPGSPLARLSGFLLIVIAITFLVEIQQPVLLASLWLVGSSGAELAAYYGHLKAFFVALAAGTGLVGASWRVLIQAIQTAERETGWSALLKSAAVRVLLLIAASILPLMIYALYVLLVLIGLGSDGAPTGGMGVFDILPPGPLRGLVAVLPLVIIAVYVSSLYICGPIPDTLLCSAWWRRNAFRSEAFFATAAIVLSAIVFAYLFGRHFADALGSSITISKAAWLYLCIASVLALVSVLFTENATSLHRLYRDRLQDAFALRSSGGRLKLLDLNKLGNGQPLRPYPILNATVNLKSSPNNKRARNADFFVFTPEYVGSDATGYVSTASFQEAEEHMDLATAVAVSGAAVSSAMGRAGVALLLPTLALLNLRLGLWVRNPRFAHTKEAREAASRGDFNVLYMLREFLGRLNERSRKVYLTDGGHIDNLGLHQLLKRRCEVIIVSDAEQDPAMTFGAYVDVERFARIDLGVRFDLPLSPVREAGLQRRADALADPIKAHRCSPTAHAAIGTIQYPKTFDGRPAKEGVILYIKASVTGDERGYVLDYERRYPKFPHEPTSDQFFSEEQFEAYRALGFHAAAGALTYSDGSARWTRLLTRVRTRLRAPAPYHQPARTGATTS